MGKKHKLKILAAKVFSVVLLSFTLSGIGSAHIISLYYKNISAADDAIKFCDDMGDCTKGYLQGTGVASLPTSNYSDTVCIGQNPVLGYSTLFTVKDTNKDVLVVVDKVKGSLKWDVSQFENIKVGSLRHSSGSCPIYQ